MVDLGVITAVEVQDNDRVKVSMTPTFSGCPALRVMEDMVRDKLHSLGIENVEVSTTFDIPWNTNRITDKGREMLKKHGLAPPPKINGYIELNVLSDVACPFCGSRNTSLESPFGPTLCRALHYCHNCLQAFEQFKPVE